MRTSAYYAMKRMAMSQRIEWPVIGVVVVSLAWATTYVVQAGLNPIDEPEAHYFIKPLLVVLWLTAPFVLWSAIGPPSHRLAPDSNTPVTQSRRILMLFSMPAYIGMIFALGLPAASALFVTASAVLYGERSPIAIIALPLLILAIIIFGFVGALGVRIPLNPYWWG